MDGKTCNGGENGSYQAPVTGLNVPDNGVATCYNTQSFYLDTCIDSIGDSCTWIFPTPGCAPTPPSPPTPLQTAAPDGGSSIRPTPPPTLPPKPPTTCPQNERTKGRLNSCAEQEKCFSISYEKVDDDEQPCEDSNCDFKWKVCIDINKDDPCCSRKQKKAFERACIRGNEIDSCLDDGVSLDMVGKISSIRFGKEYCEIVRPGENAIFQLVCIQEWDSTLIGPLMFPLLLTQCCLFWPAQSIFSDGWKDL